MGPTGLSVMTVGMSWMPVLSVGSWDTILIVSTCLEYPRSILLSLKIPA